MARRLMSRRGGSASQPQVTPYQHIELDDGWREWENTKQELALVKRQLTEKDALVIQLKTASRRLQETLRKKDKDLQAAFAILRSPQDAKTTKTRKQELIDRLVSECVQRAATAEALAEERRRELDRLRYSSKFLRFQELEAEIDECHTEIGRLRAKLETAPGSPTIAGKLKVSSVPLVTNGSDGLVKNTRLDPLNLVVDDNPGSRTLGSVPNNLAATRAFSSQSTAGQVRVVPLAKVGPREGFVSKTRRKALEAEYYKQVRLAQLEVECELEENLHIRAAREAKKLQAIEQNTRHVGFEVDSARSQEAVDITVDNNGQAILRSTEDVESNNSPGNTEEPTRVDDVEQGTDQKILEGVHTTTGTNSQTTEQSASEEGVTHDTEQTELGDDQSNQAPKIEEAHVSSDRDNGGNTEPNVVVDEEDSVQMHLKQKTYEDDDFDGSDIDEDAKPGPEPSVWILDPNMHSNGEFTAKSGSRGEVGTESTIWNADPHAVASSTSVDDPVTVNSNDNDDEPEAALLPEDSVPSEDDDSNTAWNLDPSPLVPTNGNNTVTTYPAEVQTGLEEESKIIDDADERSTWNLDPTPSSVSTAPSATIEPVGNRSDEVEQPVWNLDPNSVPDIVANPEPPPPRDSVNTEEFNPEFVEDDAAEDKTSADAHQVVDQNSPDTTPIAEPAITKEGESSAWNIDPNPSHSAHSPTDANLFVIEGSLEPVQNEEPSVPEVTSAGGDGGLNHLAQIDSDSHNLGSEVGQHNAWNLDPSGVTTDPVVEPESTQTNGHSEGEDGGEGAVWNLDPHTGDASEPINSFTDAQETAPTSTQVEAVADEQQIESSPGNDTPTFADADADMAEVPEPAEPASPPGTNENSPRESEAETPAEDDTPDYTPPSTGRDSDAAGDEDGDATW